MRCDKTMHPTMKDVDLAEQKGSRQTVGAASGRAGPVQPVAAKIERGTTLTEVVNRLRKKHGGGHAD